ncbi:MAG: PAS domain S-box protein, partial [Bacteroidota bacterium]|nr:PAS domain S-box protein [Bacteroidota bacterium]
RELVDNSPDAICIYSEGKIVLVNNAYIRLMAATSAEELLGIQIIETVHPHYRSLARERMHKAMTRLDIQPLVEEQLIRLDGTVVDIEVKAVPITFQDKQSVQVIVRDITARKKAEKERAEIQENFKDLFYNAPIGYHEIDTEGRIVRMNQTELAMLGYTEEELIGKFIWEINVNESKSQKAVKDKLQGRNFPTESFNRDFRRKDGSTFPVLLKDKLLRDNEGRITGIRTTIQDISENEKAENELKKSREEFKDLFNNAPVGYHELDSEGRIAQMNQTELDMYGYTLKEVIGKYIWEIAHNRSQTYQETKNKLKGIDIPLSSFEATLVNKKSGMRYTVLILDRILRDPDGQITGIRTTIQDITERKQAELKLRLSEERFRSIFENSTVGKSMTSVGGKLLANLAFSEIVGYSQDELSHLHWTDFTHKDDLEFNKKEIELILKGKKTYSHWEKRYIHKNGSIVWVDISTFLLRDNEGNPLYFITEVNDITERKLAEKAIKESEALYRNLVFRIPDGVYTSTPDGRFTDVNPAMVRILGYDSKEELMQIDIKSQLYLDPTERENMVLQQQHGETGIYRLKKKDGSVIWVEDQGWYNTDSDGKIVKHEGILSDITERKLAQDALQKSEFLLRNTLVKSTGLIDTNSEDIDYERISNTILEISGAKYVGFNIFEENLKDFTTVAVSGIRENLLKASSYLGFEIVNKKWKYDPVRDERTKGKPITRFESISDLSGFAIPPRITTLIESVFNLGETFIVKITKNTKTIGDFTIIYPRGETMQNNELVLLFANQVALFIDRERTNKALRINEEKYRFLFANNPQPMYIYDLETFAFLEVNLAATEHYGYSKEEFLSMTIKDIRPPEDIPALLIDAQDERSSYKPAGVWRHIKKNGEMIFVEITTVSVISSGKPVRHVLVQDITERKRAEEALRESEEKYRTMIENSNDLIWTLDKNGNFTFLNEIAQKTTGLHRDEWIGKSFMPIVMNEDLPLLTDIFTKTMKGQYCNYELRFKKSDEETLTILVNTSPIYVSGKIEGVVSFGQDITDGKKSLELLQESEEKFRSIAEQTSDLIAIADENGFIRFASTASKSTFLYNPEEMYGHHLADFLVEESIEKAITAFDRCIQKHENISNLELKMKRKDGTLFYGEINGSSFKYGNNYGTLVVLRDMTERKKAQAELEEKMDELLRFHRLTVDRELNMIELKKEVNDLLQKAGEAKKYKIVK